MNYQKFKTIYLTKISFTKQFILTDHLGSDKNIESYVLPVHLSYNLKYHCFPIDLQKNINIAWNFCRALKNFMVSEKVLFSIFQKKKKKKKNHDRKVLNFHLHFFQILFHVNILLGRGFATVLNMQFFKKILTNL